MKDTTYMPLSGKIVEHDIYEFIYGHVVRKYDIYMVYGWFIFGILLVYFWYTLNILLVYN